MAYAEIILTENIPNLGAEADIVKVRRGYARNFLLPKGKAIPATKASVQQINHLKAKRAEREAREITEAEETGRKIAKLDLSFELETGATGKAFGSVTAKDITDKIQSLIPGLELPRHAIVLEKPIKDTGDHDVSVKLHPEVTVTVNVVVKAPKAAESQAEETESKKARSPKAKGSKPTAGA